MQVGRIGAAAINSTLFSGHAKKMDELPDCKYWSANALTAVFSLWDEKRERAWRGSQEFERMQLPGAVLRFRPTVTYRAVIAFAEFGLFLDNVHFKGGIVEIGASQLRIDGGARHVTATGVLRRLLSRDDWVQEALQSSEHGASPNGAGLPPRASIALGSMVQAVSLLARNVLFPGLAEFQPRLVRGMADIANLFLAKIFAARGTLLFEEAEGRSATISSQILLYAATGLVELMRLREILVEREDGLVDRDAKELARFRLENSLPTTSFRESIAESIEPSAWDDMKSLVGLFRAYFAREVDRQMARKHLDNDPEFDCASLAFALNGLALLNDRARATSYFRSCVETVVAGQNPDGCWPAGMTVAYHETSEVGPVRQPSVEIALALASCVFHRAELFRCNDYEVALLKLALPALLKQIRFLAATYQELNDRYFGWADDRIRAPGEVRMHANAVAATLINRIRLANIACERAEILSRFRAEWPARDPGKEAAQPEEIWAAVLEPDDVNRPCDKLLQKMIRPIAEQMRAGHFFLRPKKDGVSFILYGPPGSGKTFVVSKFAAALGWPLVSLNPGYFIKDGLESIEAVAGDIFANLMRLDHAVVFFDECDELFRDRLMTEGGARNILSFATASMLPKLQKLHDEGKVLFILGTNFVRNIDPAIRRQGRFDEVLLFDRPDHAARLRIAVRAIAKLRGMAAGELGEDDRDRAARIATDTAGWMIKHIQDRTETELAGKSYPAPSISDYEDWCTKEGRAEIEAAGVPPGDRDKTLDRWREFCRKTDDCRAEFVWSAQTS